MTREAVDVGVVEPLVDLHGIFAGIRWRRGVWSTLTVVGLLLGVASALFLPQSATAAARVYVVYPEAGNSGESQEKTSVAVLMSSTVASAALQRLGSTERPENFLKTYSAESQAANTLDITASGKNADDAVRNVQAITDAFITDHINRANDSAKAVVTAIRERQAQLKDQLASLDREQAGTTPGAGAAAAGQGPNDGNRAVFQSQIDSLESQAQTDELGYPQVAAGTRILDAPHRTSRGFLTGIVINSGLGLILGLGLGLVFAVIASVVGDRPVLRRDIAAHLGASVVAQIPGRSRLPSLRAKRDARERERSVASLVRLVDSAPGPVSLLEVGCPAEAADLAVEMAAGLAAARPVTLVHDLAGSTVPPPTKGGIDVLDGTRFPPKGGVGDRRVLSVASLEPGTAWLDLRRLGPETLLVVGAGRASTAWLHTVARQLADVDILIAGIVLVNPDPRDRSDGTLWDGLHFALRGRSTQEPRSLPQEMTSGVDGTRAVAAPRARQAPGAWPLAASGETPPRLLVPAFSTQSAPRPVGAAALGTRPTEAPGIPDGPPSVEDASRTDVEATVRIAQAARLQAPPVPQPAKTVEANGPDVPNASSALNTAENSDSAADGGAVAVEKSADEKTVEESGPVDEDTVEEEPAVENRTDEGTPEEVAVDQDGVENDEVGTDAVDAEVTEDAPVEGATLDGPAVRLAPVGGGADPAGGHDGDSAPIASIDTRSNGDAGHRPPAKRRRPPLRGVRPASADPHHPTSHPRPQKESEKP